MSEKYERVELLDGAKVLVRCHKTDGSHNIIELDSIFFLMPKWFEDMTNNNGYVRFDIAVPFEMSTHHQPRIAADDFFGHSRF